jgi:hypothetical protein
MSNRNLLHARKTMMAILEVIPSIGSAHVRALGPAKAWGPAILCRQEHNLSRPQHRRDIALYLSLLSKSFFSPILNLLGRNATRAWLKHSTAAFERMHPNLS